MILVSGKHNTLNTEKQPTWLRIVYLGTLLIMGAYTGYFGAAGGVIVLVILTYITNEKFIVINAIKNVISGFANLVALIIFMFTSHIYWLQAIPLAIGMFIGGYIGPAILRRVPEKLVRILLQLWHSFNQPTSFIQHIYAKFDTIFINTKGGVNRWQQKFI